MAAVESHVTLEFLRDLFRTIDKTINIETLEETHGSGRGDNYTSSLFRIKLKGHRTETGHDITVIEPWETSIIYKRLPENHTRREAFKSEKLFQNEVAFYTKVLPLFQQFQETNGRYLSKKFQATPRCFYARDDLIILEDLKVANFEMANRKEGLNFKQISAVLEELARFHAISLAIKLVNPEDFYGVFEGENSISEGLFVEENEEWYRDYYKSAIENALDMARTNLSSNDLKDMYVYKFSGFANDDFFKKMIQLVSHKSSLSLLCHGDCWTNNILFKTTEGRLEACFIDFQLCRNGSLALDLANLIYCCTTRRMREVYMSTLLKEYHQIFHATLSGLLKDTAYEHHELTDEKFSYDLIYDEFKRCSLFGLGLAIDIIPISTCDSQEAPDMYVEDNAEGAALVPIPTINALCATKMVDLICELIDKNLL